MKRLLSAVLLLVLVLGGCMEAPQETTVIPTTDPPPTEPGLYQPDSEMEKATNGAVSVYQIALNKGGDILIMGRDILVFSYDENITTLTKLSGINARPLYTAQLSGEVTPRGNGVQIADNSLAYYDPVQRCIVYLDGMLQQTEQITIPDDLQGVPVISSDLKLAYYAADHQIRKLDLDLGISSLLHTQETEQFVPVQLVASETVLECKRIDLDGNAYTEFFSTRNGQTIAIAGDITLSAYKDAYFAELADDNIREFLFGLNGGQISALYPSEDYETVVPLLTHSKAVGLCDREEGVQADVFDLVSGCLTASVGLPGIRRAYSPVMDNDGTGLWFIGTSESTHLLCRLDLSKVSVTDPTVYSGNRHTAESPDTEGLEKASLRMLELSNRFHVDLKLWESEQNPEAYIFKQEYRGAAVDKVLDGLEQVLALFPEDFFTQLGAGKLSVEIVNDIFPVSENSPGNPESVAYWEAGRGHIAIALGDDPGAAFCGALSHVMDAYIYANSLAYDDWDSLNPAGFSYDLNYTHYADREDRKWLDGGQRAFVSEFSMTFSKEDRATIFVYAMRNGSEDIFASDTMQKKLQCICGAIRDAFGWKQDERSFAWEQYLRQSRPPA